jgi:phosphate transport system substrate-binding protein
MKKLLLVTIFIAMLFTVACANNENSTGDSDTSTLNGTINIDGSSTLYPVSEAISEEFSKSHKNVRVPVGVSGTGGGFKRFCKGEIDISNASRKIKSSEIEACKQNGVDFVELAVTYDGLTVVINKNNTWAKTMTVEQIKELFKPNSTVKTWKDLNPAWPDQTIKIYSPGADSGTFDYFTEAIVGESKASRNDSQISFSEDDNVLAQGISGDVNSIGYFGFSYYEENMNKIDAVSIDAGKGAILPSFDSISEGTYAPLGRELYVYVNKKSYERAEVKEYTLFLLDNVKNIAEQVGFVPLPEEMISEEKAKLP